jgi:N-acyl-L-homoserine lactone synthetase
MPQGNSQEAMMTQLVTHDMHRLRYRVFKERLGWDVQVSGGMEIDEFDALHPAYLLQRGSDDRLQGCVRVLPSAGPNMLRDTCPALLDGRSTPASPKIWESSRFALDAVPSLEGRRWARPGDV